MGRINTAVIIAFAFFDQLAIVHISISPTIGNKTRKITDKVSFPPHSLEVAGGVGGVEGAIGGIELGAGGTGGVVGYCWSIKIIIF